MAYNPTTDFVALWRALSNGAQKAEMPALDFMVAALNRSGIMHVVVSNTQPTGNPAVTPWFRPAVPTYSAEGSLLLWEASTNSYKPATPKLFLAYLNAS